MSTCSPSHPDRIAPLASILVAAVLALASALWSSSPARAEAPAAYMQRVANELLAASRTGSVSSMAAVIRSHADVASIGLTALGSYASVLPKSDRPAYYNGMINFVARYAAKEAPKYPIARVVMLGQSVESGGNVAVDSRVTLASGEDYDVRWILVKRGAGYKVRDAEVIGYRMSAFLDTLFQNWINGEGRGDPRNLVLALNR